MMNKESMFEEFCNWYEKKYNTALYVRREHTVNTNQFFVGDKIDFTLSNGEPVTAVAIREENDGMLFVLEDCLKEECNRKEIIQKMNTDILASFPDEIQVKMVKFADGNYLRLLTEKEVFGQNQHGKADNGERIEYFKEKRNRIAFQGKGINEWEHWWLQNPYYNEADENTATYFALVSSNGNADYYYASSALGVRPAFKLRNR